MSVHQRGGILGIDKTVEVEDATVRVKEKGVMRRKGVLDDRTRDELHKLAAKAVADAVVKPAKGPVYDEMSTNVEIDDGRTVHAITVRTGDAVPAHVRQLIRAVTKASRSATLT